MIIDMHVHTNVSFDSKIKLGILLKKMKELGVDGIAITDHDSFESIQKAKEIAQKYEVKVFTGIEITTKQGHILAYGINEKTPYLKSIKETIDWIHDRNGFVAGAHPFRVSSPSIGEAVYGHNFNAIEINGKCSATQNRAAELAANVMKLPLVGGSDAHFLNNIGEITTVFPEEFDTDDELLSVLRSKNYSIDYRTPISIKAELILPISTKELTVFDKIIQSDKQPLAPIIEASRASTAQFFDRERKDTVTKNQ